MRTIGRKWPGSPSGDYPVVCAYCDVVWPRSKCVLDSDGLFQCPDDRGYTRSELDRMNAQGAKQSGRLAGKQDGTNKYSRE